MISLTGFPPLETKNSYSHKQAQSYWLAIPKFRASLVCFFCIFLSSLFIWFSEKEVQFPFVPFLPVDAVFIHKNTLCSCLLELGTVLFWISSLFVDKCLYYRYKDTILIRHFNVFNWEYWLFLCEWEKYLSFSSMYTFFLVQPKVSKE